MNVFAKQRPDKPVDPAVSEYVIQILRASLPNSRLVLPSTDGRRNL
jgi:hypothetical protein